MFWQSIDINSIQLKVNFDPETGEGTIEWPAAESTEDEAEAGSKMKSIKWQSA